VIALAKTAMSIATWLFFIGFVGSLIVVVISFIEDLSQLGGKD
jgi:O-antigen/teichoic acid export membrane protein